MKKAGPARGAGDYILEEQVGHLLRRAHQRHAAIFQEHLNASQLTPLQFAALVKLGDVGEVSQKQLGRLTAMDAATMQGVIRRLLARNLIDRRPDPGDRRRLRLRLASGGRTLLADCLQAGHAITEATLEPLTSSERKTFLNLLKKLSA